MKYEIHNNDCLSILRTLPDKSINCCVTSPPYYGLRDYGVDGQIGLEETPDDYVNALVTVFREVRRVLKDDGTLWVNLGDSYSAHKDCRSIGQTLAAGTTRDSRMLKSVGLKNKDLIGIPWMVAFALRGDGWYLRSDIIWHKCLSGGTWLYVKSKKGVMPMMVKDMVRLSDIQLWDGEKWVKVVSWSKNERTGKEIELVLRSGERISCTPEHRFPTTNGLKKAKDLVIGESLQSIVFPDESKTPAYLTADALWFIGLYVAEGSRANDTIQIAGHVKESERWERMQKLCSHYGARCTRTIRGNSMDIRVYGKVINAIIDQHVSGSNAKDKGLTTACWQYDNTALNCILSGYLSGDGYFDSRNNRYRLGFTRNYNLERDLRLICARLGYSITLNISTVAYGGGQLPTFRGEIRMGKSDNWNVKDRNEIVEIRNARCRYTYDIAVDSDPHLFALASGVLTHNSNPMPESVTDRPTKAHEYIFLLSKSQNYYYDSEAIKEDTVNGDPTQLRGSKGVVGELNGGLRKQDDLGNRRYTGFNARYEPLQKRNKRSVWTVSTKPYKEAHFATYPPDLILPCILAGCPEGGTVLDPFNGSGTTGQVALENDRNYIGIELNPEYVELSHKRLSKVTQKPKLFSGLVEYGSLDMFAVVESGL